MVPISNPKAFESNQRFVEENLNRVFNPDYDSTSYESTLAPIIRKYIDETEYMLDIHSLSWGDWVFLFKSNTSGIKEVDEFARASWIEQSISWWWELYEDNGLRTTNDYANSVWVHWILIECWQHEDPDAKNVAYRAIINSMKHLWMIDWVVDYVQTPMTFHLKELFYKPEEWLLTKAWKHWDVIKAWTVVARDTSSGDEIIAQEDCIMVLPKHRAESWWEWFYLAKSV